MIWSIVIILATFLLVICAVRSLRAQRRALRNMPRKRL